MRLDTGLTLFMLCIFDWTVTAHRIAKAEFYVSAAAAAFLHCHLEMNVGEMGGANVWDRKSVV